jgi:putative oxidoreductase
MATHVIDRPYTSQPTDLSERTESSLRLTVPLGRALFAAIFLAAAPGHFAQRTIDYASSAGVPFASVLVPASGLLALAGGLSVLVGYRTRVGAWLLVAFLVPVTLMMHRFWGAVDPSMVDLQRVMFLKNLSMLGGALLLAYYGGGPVSLDGRRHTTTVK